MSIPTFINDMNKLAKSRIPFIFIIDYNANNGFVEKLSSLSSNDVIYSVNGKSNYNAFKNVETIENFTKKPIPIERFEKGFSVVKKHLRDGNSYLCNYTCETPINTNNSLKHIFYKSKAPYKLWFRNKFVVFSPEIFVRIANGKIYSFPMKGTIDASEINAEQKILNNKKESAEHATIVDLIRNDLSQVATNVKVDKYRYIDHIKTNQKNLLQVSSQISGDLPENSTDNIGSIIYKLLPAGSISGAPKQKTLQIIDEAETYQRGFYTGVFGIFDGTNLDSGVMIRFIEKQDNKLIYKSGGGITVNSKLEEEYNEMINKVYLPFD